MNPKIALRSTAAALLLAGLAAAPWAQAQDTAPAGASERVSVELGAFDQMTEVRRLRGQPRRSAEQGIRSLARWLESQAAPRVPADQRLHVTLVDVDLAGDYEPGASIDMQDVRVVKDIYPPRIEIRWAFSDAAGEVLREGEGTLRDPGFMTVGGVIDSDTLRYEKRLLRDWLRRVLPPSAP